MKKLFILSLFLASCSSSEEAAEEQSGGTAPAPAAAEGQPSGRAAPPAQLASLVGLYEGGDGERRNQMCVVEGQGGEQRFGLIVWGANQHSCMGSGTTRREGNRLRLSMAGDSDCTIQAEISGKSVRLPADVPQGCSYYCGQRASLSGAELTQQEATEQAAMRAKDLVGESLCAGENG